jgi:TatD DNase family protein
MLVDSHCHLDFPDFGPELDAVVQRARAAGVATMLTIGTRLSAFEGVRAIAERYDDIWCSVGVHPHEAAVEPLNEAKALIERAAHPRVVGIGEAGLDYFYEHSPRDDQIRNFRAHIEASRETQLPLIVHARDADDDLCEILSEETKRGAFPGLIHCFSSTAKLAKVALDIGFYISISGIVTFKKADERSLQLFRWSACWSKRTRLISRRCPIAASATSRLS